MLFFSFYCFDHIFFNSGSWFSYNKVVSDFKTVGWLAVSWLFQQNFSHMSEYRCTQIKPVLVKTKESLIYSAKIKLSS